MRLGIWAVLTVLAVAILAFASTTIYVVLIGPAWPVLGSVTQPTNQAYAQAALAVWSTLGTVFAAIAALVAFTIYRQQRIQIDQERTRTLLAYAPTMRLAQFGYARDQLRSDGFRFHLEVKNESLEFNAESVHCVPIAPAGGIAVQIAGDKSPWEAGHSYRIEAQVEESALPYLFNAEARTELAVRFRSSAGYHPVEQMVSLHFSVSESERGRLAVTDRVANYTAFSLPRLLTESQFADQNYRLKIFVMRISSWY